MPGDAWHHIVEMSSIACFLALLPILFTLDPPASPPGVRSLPPFQIKLIDGAVLRSKDLVGKVTIIDFWGTWCPPCLVEIPEYNAFYKEYRGRGVGLYGLAVDSGSEKEVREAVRRLRISYPIAVPSTTQLDALGDFPVFPTTWVINRQGSIEKEFLGSSPRKQKLLRETVDRLLKEPAKPLQ